MLKCNLCFDVKTTLWTIWMVILYTGKLWGTLYYYNEGARVHRIHGVIPCFFFLALPASDVICLLFSVFTSFIPECRLDLWVLCGIQQEKNYYFYAGKENSSTYSTKSSESMDSPDEYLVLHFKLEIVCYADHTINYDFDYSIRVSHLRLFFFFIGQFPRSQYTGLH